MRLGDHPSPHGLLVSRRIASDKASMLAKGSPIPMKTRLVIRSSSIEVILGGQHLFHDFMRLQVALQSHCAGQTESAIQGTADLR